MKFYCDVLGFKVSDWMGDFFAFLRCGPDHHTINLVSAAKDKMHHIAFELRDWTHIRDACDWLATDRIPLVWGQLGMASVTISQPITATQMARSLSFSASSTA